MFRRFACNNHVSYRWFQKSRYVDGCRLYVLAAIIRLAWFNVDEEKRQDSASKCREFYTGMPVTVSAFILPIVLALANISGNSMLIPGTITLLVLAFAFIAPIKVPKLNFSIGHQKITNRKIIVNNNPNNSFITFYIRLLPDA